MASSSGISYEGCHRRGLSSRAGDDDPELNENFTCGNLFKGLID